MGNCLFGVGGMGEVDKAIKVITSNGGIMEFYPPITASCITEEFAGHAIFPSHDLFWKPVSNHEELVAGKSYYLLPLNISSSSSNQSQIVRQGHIRSNSIPNSLVTSYRMSFDYQGMLKRSYTEAFSSSRYSNSSNTSTNGNVFWKVKLVISPQQLLEILSKESRTLELIESVRTVAKCGNGVSSDDQWTLSASSSRNASSKNDYLLDM